MNILNKKNRFIIILFSVFFSLNFTTFKHHFILNPDLFLIELNNNIFKFTVVFMSLFILFYFLFNFFFEKMTKTGINKTEKIILIIICFFSFSLFFLRYEYFYLNLIIFYFTFALLSYLIYISTKDIKFDYDIINKKTESFILLILILIILILNFLRINSYHQAFHTNASDFGIFLNTLFQISNNNPLYTWIEGFNTFRFGVHFDWFLYVLALFYKINNSPEFFLFLQTFAIYFSALILFLISNLIIKNAVFSFLISTSYMISPLVSSAIDFDFHLDAFYPLFIFAFVYYNLRNKLIISTVFFVLSISLKEEIGIYLFFLSIFLYFFTKSKYNIILSLLSLLYTILVIKFIMPALSVGFTHGQDHILSILNNFFLDLTNPNKLITFIFYYLGAVFFIPLLSVSAFILILLPAAFIHYFHYKMYDIQYAALVLPGLYLSLIFTLSIKKFKNVKLEILGLMILILTTGIHFYKTPNYNLYGNLFLIAFILLIPYFIIKMTKKVHLYLLITILITNVFYNGYYSYNKYRAQIDKNRKKILQEALSLLPSDKNIPVFANCHLVPHFSDRKYVANIETNEKNITINTIYNNCKLVYILVDFNFDYINGAEILEKAIYSTEIIKNKLRKMHYNENIIFSKNNIILYKFEKSKDKKIY